jgi:predicted nucleotidyltransferase
MDSAKAYDELVETARRDENIVGLVLTGSRGRGFAVTEESDWDVRLVVRDEVVDEYRARLATCHGAVVNVVVFALSEFEQVGEVGTESAWDRFSYVRADVVIDVPDGRIAELVRIKSTLPADAARQLAAEHLDDYVNSYYRAAKNLRSGLNVEANLDAAASVSALLDFLFAVHERVRPFNRFLRWELENHPLPGEMWAADSLLPRLQEILSSGDIGEQQRVFRDVETLARLHDLDDVIDGWEPDLDWLRVGGSPHRA